MARHGGGKARKAVTPTRTPRAAVPAQCDCRWAPRPGSDARMITLKYAGASTALFSAPPAARRNDQLSAVVARLRRGVPRPLGAYRRTCRTRRPEMPASAYEQALADELSRQPRLAHIVILDESRCQPACPRTTICARRPPLGCARAPTCIEFEEGRCVVLERRCGGTEEEARDGARACPTCLSLFLLNFTYV